MIPNQSQWCFWRGFVLFRVTREYSIFFSVSVTHLFIRSAFWSPKFHANDVNHWLLLLLVRSHAVFKCFSWAIIIIIIIVIFWTYWELTSSSALLTKFSSSISQDLLIFSCLSVWWYTAVYQEEVMEPFFFCKFLVLKSHTLISIKCWSEKYFFWLINVLSHQWSFRTELFSNMPTIWLKSYYKMKN